MSNTNCNSCDYCNYCYYCDYCNSCYSCDYCNYCYYCNSCNSCDYCNYCYYCNSCNYCDYCNYCYYCNSCYYCDYCNSCYYCDYCNYCNYCDYCKGLRISENMLFCLGEGSCVTQGAGYQKNNCVFNIQLKKDEVDKIKATLDIKLKLTKWNESAKSLDVYSYTDAWKNWWKEATDKQKKAITDIKYFDPKIFKEITGIDVKETSLKGKKVYVELDGQKYTAIIQ